MALVLGLLVATAAAFGVTETLKLQKSPIIGLREFRAFSPTCDCSKAREELTFRLRTADDVTLTILDAGRRHVVRTIAAGDSVPRGWSTFTWNGRTDEGAVAPDGRY